ARSPTRGAGLILLDGGRRLLPGRTGPRGRPPRIAALRLCGVDRSAGGLGLLPGPLRAVPQRREHPPGLVLGMKDIQSLHHPDRLTGVLLAIALPRSDARLESRSRVADDRMQPAPGLQFPQPVAPWQLSAFRPMNQTMLWGSTPTRTGRRWQKISSRQPTRTRVRQARSRR